MSSTIELAELHQLIVGLQRCVSSLKSHYGKDPAMARVVNDAERILNDVERLDIDVVELDQSRGGAPVHLRPGEKISIPDTQYDSEFWRDVDDEGVGGHNRLR